jgi:pimeloyl-ACP methyl ester carboxylesterase
MLSFLVFRPDTRGTADAVLVFLHGVGEAFLNTDSGSVGFKHLFQQGVPKALYDPAAELRGGHPLSTGAFVVVAPLLGQRHTSWTEGGHGQQVRDVLNTIAAESARQVYVMGFSKGGQAAFRLASELRAKAIVTIDASPMGEKPEVVAREISRCTVPFWALYTTYPQGHRLEPRIPPMHDAMDVPLHAAGAWDNLSAPATRTRSKSLIVMDHEDAGSRHGALCTAVTRAPGPFEWLLKHR